MSTPPHHKWKTIRHKSELEGFAAPLEPSAFTARDFYLHRWSKTANNHTDYLEFAEAYAAAVSKNLQEERDRLLLAKDCDKCGEEITPMGYRLCGKCTSELEKEITALRETKL